MIGNEMGEKNETKEPLYGDSMVSIILGMLNRGLVMLPCGCYGNVFRIIPPHILTKENVQKAWGDTR